MTKTTIKELEVNGETYVLKSDAKAIAKPEGDYVVVRTYSAGVHAGYLKSKDGDEVVLMNTRRLWYWDGAATLSQVAGTGITKPNECKFPAQIAEITLKGVIEIIPATEGARKIIEGVKEWVK